MVCKDAHFISDQGDVNPTHLGIGRGEDVCRIRAGGKVGPWHRHALLLGVTLAKPFGRQAVLS